MIKHFNCFSIQEPKCCIFKKICFGQNIEVALLSLEVFSLSCWIWKCDCLPDALEPSRALTDGNVTRGLYSWDVYTTVCKFSHMTKPLVSPGESLAVEVCGVVIDISTREVAVRGTCSGVKPKTSAQPQVSWNFYFPSSGAQMPGRQLTPDVPARGDGYHVWWRVAEGSDNTRKDNDMRQWDKAVICSFPVLETGAHQSRDVSTLQQSQGSFSAISKWLVRREGQIPSQWLGNLASCSLLSLNLISQLKILYWSELNPVYISV